MIVGVNMNSKDSFFFFFMDVEVSVLRPGAIFVSIIPSVNQQQ